MPAKPKSPGPLIGINIDNDIAQLIERLWEYGDVLAKEFELINKLEDTIDIPDTILPLPVPIDSEHHNRVIQLDRAIMCVHLTAAKFAVNRIPTLVRDKLIEISDSGVRSLAYTASWFSRIATFVNWILFFAHVVYNAIRADVLAQEIQAESHRLRSELLTLTLAPNNPRQSRAIWRSRLG